MKVNSIETAAQLNDAFLVVFKKHDAIMLLIDPHTGQILDANPAAEKFYGYSFEQFRELRITDVNQLPPEEVAEQRCHAVTGEKNQFIFPHRLASGEIRIVEVHSSPVKVRGKDVLFSIIIDKTEHKQTESELRKSEQKFRQLAENIPSVIYQCHNNTSYSMIYINRAVEKLTGYLSKEFMDGSISFVDLYHPDDIEIANAPFSGEFRIVYRIRHKSGEWRWVDEWGAGITDSDGVVKYIEGVMVDITERKRMENALRDSEEKYRSLFDRMMDGIYRSTHEGRFVDVNPAMVKMFGFSSREEMLSADIKNELYFAPEERGSHILDTGQEEVDIYRMKRKDGSEIWVEDHGYYVHDEAGNVIYHEGLLRDITDRRQMEEILHRRLAELEALHKVSASLRTAQSFDEALPILLDRTLDALVTTAGAILLYNKEANELVPVISRGWFLDLHAMPVGVDTGVAGKVHVTGKSYHSDEFIKDIKMDHSGIGSIPEGWGGACVPIRAGNEAVGVLFISVQLPRVITHEQMKLLHSLSEIAGATMHRTRLFDETSRRAREFAFLYEMSNRLSASGELNDMLQTIVESAKTLLDSSYSSMYLVDDSSNGLVMTVDSGYPFEPGAGLKLGEGLAGRVGETRQPMRVDDYSTWDGRLRQFDAYPIRAVLAVPMLYSGELIGVLEVDEFGEAERKFTEVDEHLLTLFATQAAGAIHSTRLRQEALHRLENIQTLHTIDKAIASSLDLRITLNLLLYLVVTQLNVDAADVLLYYPHEQKLRYSAGEGFRTPVVESTNVQLNDMFAGRAVMERRTLKIVDRDELVNNKSFYRFWVEEKFINYICIPLVVKGEVKGVLEIYSRTELPQDNEWAEFLETLASQAAITIDNAQLFESVQKANMELAAAYEATIEGWSHALDLRDKETEGHTRRVTELTLKLAEAMGIKDNELQHIRRGALLHDIGKMGISDSILYKDEKLTPKEWKIMRTHPELAYKMLKPISYLKPSLDIPYCHHEKWDGSGYPRGLKGDLIPLSARIFAIADVWDALTNKRPYRQKEWTEKQAIEYIRNESGKHFDPEIVEVFLRVMKEK